VEPFATILTVHGNSCNDSYMGTIA